MRSKRYLPGFNNYHHSEAKTGALPENQNSPQQCNFGLYAEQLSGSAFTRSRANNLHSWLYRILPTVSQGAYHPYEKELIKPYHEKQSPNALRWSPLASSSTPCDFVDGLFHIAGSHLINTYIYSCNKSMTDTYFANHDGEMLFVPYEGEINLHTELGCLSIGPKLIAVIPRGIKFKVELISSNAKGYLCENGGNPLTLPELGIIGANGLANPRHFLYPVAAFEQHDQECMLICKHQDHFWRAQCPHSPLNVVAWHGNYAPYCYDLSLFNTINTVSFDHPDPSIYTVLTSESDTPGVAHLDFVIFPPRWMVAEHTFRPPYFHRNIMNELMGLIDGEYDAKKNGFFKGGVSIHNRMTPHGPDLASYKLASTQELKPEFNNSLAFMFETKNPWQITAHALKHKSFQKDYIKCWDGYEATAQLS